MIEHQPKSARMVKEQQREDHGKGNPDRELSINRQFQKDIKKEKSRDCDGDSCGVIDVDSADEIALLSLELETAGGTMVVHAKRLCIERAGAAARAFEAYGAGEHRNEACHTA